MIRHVSGRSTPNPSTRASTVLACGQCRTAVAASSSLVSTAFTGHAGRAALFSQTFNVLLDPPSIMLMHSGSYTIAEFICSSCEAYLGWKLVRAHDAPERWKEGHFILELELVVEREGSEDGDAEADAVTPVSRRAPPLPSPKPMPHHRTPSGTLTPPPLQAAHRGLPSKPRPSGPRRQGPPR